MEKVKLLINQLRNEVENYFGKDASGHSVDHLERTLNNALYLQSKEGGDKVVVAVAAYIHDVHRILGEEKKRFVTPKESLPVVRSFIKDLDITKEQKKKILFAIEHHEEYKFGEKGINVEDIESKILQDADNLDAIGAVGLARLFKFGAVNNVKDYDPKVPLYRDKFDDSRTDASSIHHIYNKLLRLGDAMHTKTARKLAKKKTKLMKHFMDMFINETLGNF